MPRNPFLDQVPIQEFPLTSYYLQNKINTGGGMSATSASYADTASYTPNAIVTASLRDDNYTIMFVKGDESNFDLSINNVVSSSYSNNGFPYTGEEATITGQLQITGSIVSLPIPITVDVNKTASIPCSQGNIFTLNLTTRDNVYLTATNIQIGQTILLQITQPNPSGSMTYNNSIIKFPSGSSFTPTPLNSATDVLYFTSFNTSSLLCYSMKNFV